MPLLAVVCLAPLPYGSASSGWTLVWLGVLGVLVAAQSLLLRPPEKIDSLVCIAVLGLGLVGLAWLQTRTGLPSGWSHPAWEEAARLGISGIEPRPTLDAGVPFEALAGPALMLVAFAAGYLQAYRRRFVWRLTRALVLSSLAWAVLGVVIAELAPGHILLEQKVAYRENVTGTFVNRNTAATYFGVGSLAAMALAFRIFRRTWPEGSLPPQERFRFVIFQLTSPTAGWCAGAAALIASVLLTGSRAGAAATLCAAGVAVVLAFGKGSTTRRLWSIGVGILALVLVAEVFGGGQIGARLTSGFQEDGRLTAWLAMLDLLRTYPWLGTGLGTFKDAFPLVRNAPAGMMLVWERAHNTPLELAIELGLPAALLVVGLWCGMMIVFLRRYSRERDAFVLPALAFAIMVLAGLHSLVDFSLQITGFVIPLAVFLGAAWRQTEEQPDGRQQR